MKYWPVLVTLINWLLKPKCMLKPSFLYEDTICFFFNFFLERLGCMHKNKIFYFILFFYYSFSFLMKTRYLILDLYLYSIKIQINIDQNAIKYLRKIIDFLKEFFFYFRAGPNPAHVAGLDPATPCGWAGPS